MILTLLGMAFLTIILIVLVIFASYQAKPGRIGYIGLPRRVIPDVIKALGLQGEGVLFDLGCGDGRVLQAALERSARVKAVGVEVNPMVMILARLALHPHRAQLKLIRGDIFKQDLTEARWVFCYLNDPTMAKLEPKLSKELKPGSRVVSCDFPLPNRNLSQKIKVGERWQLAQTLYIYEF